MHDTFGGALRSQKEFVAVLYSHESPVTFSLLNAYAKERYVLQTTTMTSHATYLPEAADLEVQEINMSSPAMKAAGPYMNLHCENEVKEFMLCRAEEKDPRKCLAEGKALTACGIRFLQEVKKLCRTQFDAYAKCIDYEGDMRVYDSQYMTNSAHPMQSYPLSVADTRSDRGTRASTKISAYPSRHLATS